MQRRSKFVSITRAVHDPEADYVTDTPVLPYGTSENSRRVRGKAQLMVPFEDGPFYPPVRSRYESGRVVSYPPPLLIKDVETLVVADDQQDTEDPMDDLQDLLLGSSLRFGGHRRGQDASEAYAEESRSTYYGQRALLPSMASPSIFPVMFCTEPHCERRAVVWQVQRVRYHRDRYRLYANCLLHLPFLLEEAELIVNNTDRTTPIWRCHPLGLIKHQELRKQTEGTAYRHSPATAFLGPVERSRLIYSLIQNRRKFNELERIYA